MPSESRKSHKVCDVCGAPDPHERTLDHYNFVIKNFQSDLICQKCLDAWHEPDYIERMLDILFEEEKNRHWLEYELERLEIETAGEEDSCSLCGRTCGHDFREEMI